MPLDEIFFNVSIGGVEDGFIAGSDFRIEADTGVVAPGTSVATWTDSQNGAVLTDVADVSVLFTGPALSQVLRISNDGGGMESADVSSIPAGDVDFTMLLAASFDTGAFGYAGLGIGTAVAGQAATIGISGDGRLTFDWYGTGNNISAGGDLRGTGPHTFGVSYDSSIHIATVYLDGVEVTSGPVTLNIVAGLIRLMTTFSKIGSGGWVGAAAVFPSNFNAAQHLQIHNYWSPVYMLDLSPPVGTSVLLANPTDVSMGWSFTSSEAGEPDYVNPEIAGGFWAIMDTDATTPTIEQVKAGLNGSGGAADWGLDKTLLQEGSNAGTASGLTAGAGQYFFAVLRDNAANEALIEASNNGLATLATDVTSPALSAATLTATGANTATGAVTSDYASDGTLRKIIQTSATPPSQGVMSGAPTQAMTANPQALSFSGLTPSQDYYAWVQQIRANGVVSAITQLVGGGAGGKVTTSAGTTPTTDITPDTTVSTPAALIALLDSWESNWAGTVPSGKTSGDERVVGITGDYSSLDLRYDFSVASGRQRVTIRGVGTFGQTGSSFTHHLTWPASFFGPIDCTTGCKNLRIMLLRAGSGTPFRTVGSEDLTLERILLLGAGYGRWDDLSNVPSAGRALSLADDTASGDPSATFTNNLTIKDCVIKFYVDGALVRGRHNNLKIEGCIWDVISHDNVKTHTLLATGYNFDRNWGSRNHCAPASTDYHEDFNQWTYSVTTDALCWGNVAMLGEWKGATGANQGFFIAPAPLKAEAELYNSQLSNNIFISNNKFIEGGAIGTGNNVSYNGSFCCFFTGTSSLAEMYVNGWGPWTCDHNVVSLKDDGAPATGKGDINGGLRLAWQTKDNPDPTQHLVHFDDYPVRTSMFGIMRPKTSSGMHWNNQQYGPWERFKEIFVDGIHPGNVGWPVGPVWTDRYNRDGAIASNDSGVYDGNGDNV